jgi:hypothetical protein
MASGPALSDRSLRTLLATGRKLNTRDPAVVKQVAAQFLSQLFFAPMLAEARQFPLGRELGTGGRTEAIFGAELDQRIADRVTAADPGLVAQLMRRFAPGADRVALAPTAQRRPTAEGDAS